MKKFHRALMLGLLGVSLATTSSLPAREIILNYVDPAGVTVGVTAMSQADQVASWFAGQGTSAADLANGQFAVRGRSSASEGRDLNSVLFSHPAAGTQLGAFKGRPVQGPALQIEHSTQSLSGLPLCQSGAKAESPCRLSDLSSRMLALIIASASGVSSTADALLSARGLIFDAQAEKRVIVSVRSDGMPDHFDFVGLVRDRNEELQAPDAVSRFILRLDANGVLSVLERQQDSKPDPQKLKFGD